jgi:hypothetical protein
VPVRNPLKHAGRPGYGVPSEKKGKTEELVHCESGIERDYAHLLNYDPQVVWYEEQPIKITYIFEQKKRSYTPDFAVHWRQGLPSLVECKPASRLNDPENLQKWTAARLWCDLHGYTFLLVTDESLKKWRVVLDNIKNMAGHAHQRITPQAKEHLLRIVQAENRALSVEEVVERASPLEPYIVRSCLWHMLYTRELFTDLTIPLHVKTTKVSFHHP